MHTHLRFASILFALLCLAGCSVFGHSVRIENGRIQYDGHIMFASDSDEILSESGDLLDALARVLKDHPDIHTVRLDGHTDTQGSADHNLDLSRRRAAAVAEALRSRGVEQTLRTRGLGEGQPLCEEDTDACHARNRRVEFIIVD